MKTTNRGKRPKRGEVWLIDFDPTIGSDVAKYRPAVVVGVDSIGKLPLRIVVPVTDWQDRYNAFLWFTKIEPASGNGLNKTSGADAFQVKSVSLDRFGKEMGRVTPAQLKNIVDAIALCIGV